MSFFIGQRSFLLYFKFLDKSKFGFKNHQIFTKVLPVFCKTLLIIYKVACYSFENLDFSKDLSNKMVTYRLFNVLNCIL